jgi:hypothetical protein
MSRSISDTNSYYRPDCSFTITADAKHEVDESDETNNTATGLCLG